MNEFLKLMKAFPNTNPVKSVQMLLHKVIGGCEMREVFRISQPTVSNNFKILEDAGMVAFEKDGFRVDHPLTDGGTSPYMATLLENLRHWMEDETEVKEIIENIPHIHREVFFKNHRPLFFCLL